MLRILALLLYFSPVLAMDDREVEPEEQASYFEQALSGLSSAAYKIRCASLDGPTIATTVVLLNIALLIHDVSGETNIKASSPHCALWEGIMFGCVETSKLCTANSTWLKDIQSVFNGGSALFLDKLVELFQDASLTKIEIYQIWHAFLSNMCKGPSINGEIFEKFSNGNYGQFVINPMRLHPTCAQDLSTLMAAYYTNCTNN